MFRTNMYYTNSKGVLEPVKMLIIRIIRIMIIIALDF